MLLIKEPNFFSTLDLEFLFRESPKDSGTLATTGTPPATFSSMSSESSVLVIDSSDSISLRECANLICKELFAK